jgi:hypothetical protein
MDGAQARAFSRNLDLRAPDRAVRIRTSVGDAQDRSITVIGELKKHRWQARTAKIEMPDVVGTVRRDLDVAISEARPGGLRVRIKIVFDRAVEITHELMARIGEVVRAWLAGPGSVQDTLDLMSATRRLLADLEKIDPSVASVRSHIAVQTAEIQVVRHGLPGGHAAAE